jgi:hypothetical protein
MFVSCSYFIRTDEVINTWRCKSCGLWHCVTGQVRRSCGLWHCVTGQIGGSRCLHLQGETAQDKAWCPRRLAYSATALWEPYVLDEYVHQGTKTMARSTISVEDAGAQRFHFLLNDLSHTWSKNALPANVFIANIYMNGLSRDWREICIGKCAWEKHNHLERDVKGVDPWTFFLWPQYKYMVHGVTKLTVTRIPLLWNTNVCHFPQTPNIGPYQLI